MKRRRLSASIVLAASAASPLAGCSSDSPAPAVSVTVSPSAASLLTCSAGDFTASVTGSANTAVSFSVNPSTAGEVDQSGHYVTPNVVPDPPEVKLVATSRAAPSAKGSATVSLATAIPSSENVLDGPPGYAELGGTGTYTHVVAARGERVYVAWPDPSDPETAALVVARSDDGGVTWQAPVTAIAAGILDDSAGAAGGLECPAISIDAGDPDVLYALAHVVAENEYGKPLDDSASGPQTELFAVSTDAGATWTTHVLHVGANGDVCADVASPAADTVVVASPGWSSCTPDGDDARDIFVWSDTERGKGFAKGSYTDKPVEYFAKGYTHALDDLAGEGCTDAHLWPESNGGTDAAGDTTESPRLFSDGAGRLCVTYVGNVTPSDDTTLPNVYVQCSTDSGLSFTAPDKVDPTNDVNGSSASGAIAPDGSLAILFTSDGDDAGILQLAVDRAGTGMGFSPVASIPTYLEASGERARAVNPALAYDADGILWLGYRTVDSGTLVVDKSCDGGVLFSGPVAVSDGTSELRWPSFATVDGVAPSFVAWGPDHLGSFTLAP
jgi:hypothetical protein